MQGLTAGDSKQACPGCSWIRSALLQQMPFTQQILIHMGRAGWFNTLGCTLLPLLALTEVGVWGSKDSKVPTACLPAAQAPAGLAPCQRRHRLHVRPSRHMCQ